LPCCSLARLTDGGTIVAFSEWEGTRERIGRRRADGSQAETALVGGSPASVVALTDGSVLATVMNGRIGSVWQWRPSEEHPRCLLPPREGADELGWGACSACRAPDGSSWLLAERWRVDSVGISLVVVSAFGVPEVCWESDASGDCRRPSITRRGAGAAATWDEWDGARSRIVAADVSATRGGFDVREIMLPCPAGHGESLASVAADAEGSLWVACCREAPADFRGAFIRHSELVVRHRRPGGDFRDAVFVDVDHALNPWMAAYWGHRRFPWLRALGGETWLIF
jgi:hypothetical protein